MPLTRIIKNFLIAEVFINFLGIGCVSVMDKDRSIEYHNIISTQGSINRENNKSEKTKKAYTEDTLFIKEYNERGKNNHNHPVYSPGLGEKNIGANRTEASATLMFIFPDKDSLE